MDVISHGPFIDLGSAAFLGADAAGEVAEVIDGQRNVGVEGFADRFAVVPGFGNGQQFKVLLDAVGNLQQHVGAVLHGSAAPGVGSGMGSVERFIDVFGSGAGEFGNQFAIHRGRILEVLPLDRSYELATDVVAVAVLEGNLRAVGTGMCVTHGVSPGCYVC